MNTAEDIKGLLYAVPKRTNANTLPPLPGLVSVGWWEESEQPPPPPHADFQYSSPHECRAIMASRLGKVQRNMDSGT